MNCKNCGHTVNGNFCSNCGQSAKVGKLNFSNFLKELSETVFQVNKGFFYTAKELFTKPGYTVQSYLNGERVNYFKPVGYVLLLSTIYYIITQLTNQNTWLDDLVTGFSIGALGEGEKEVELPPLLLWFSKNFAYSTLLLLPVFSFCSYLLFRKNKINYIEHIVLNAYITGQQAILYSVFAIAGMFIKNDILGLFTSLATFFYTVFVFWQFFSEGNRILNVLRTIFTYILYLIFSISILVLLLAISEFLI